MCVRCCRYVGATTSDATAAKTIVTGMTGLGSLLRADTGQKAARPSGKKIQLDSEATVLLAGRAGGWVWGGGRVDVKKHSFGKPIKIQFVGLTRAVRVHSGHHHLCWYIHNILEAKQL